jgi:hypothetical protein
MKALTNEEARKWCSRVGPKMAKDGLLSYQGLRAHAFYLQAPEEFREIVVIARAMLTFRGEADFSGGMLWLRRWDIGSPQLVRVGWRILERMRGAQGESRPLEVAPAAIFRDDELVDLHSYLLQVIGFGWVADFVRPTGDFFLHFKNNRQVCFTADSTTTLKELRAAFSAWNPTEEDPMVVKMRAIEKARRSNRQRAD